MADQKPVEVEVETPDVPADATECAKEALRAIKLGQYNSPTDGLQRARGTIGELAGYVFQLALLLEQASNGKKATKRTTKPSTEDSDA